MGADPGPVLVTGATGFVGRNLCPYLVDRGHRVRALVRRTSDHGFLDGLEVEKAWGDLRDPASVMAAVEGCRAVIHVGAVFRFWGRREEFWATNVEGTRNVLEAARRAGVGRFVHISTIAVVGKPPAEGLITEETPCQPQDAYQESKLEAGRLGRACGRGGGLAFRVHGERHITFPAFVRDVAWAAAAGPGRGRAGPGHKSRGAGCGLPAPRGTRPGRPPPGRECATGRPASGLLS